MIIYLSKECIFVAYERIQWGKTYRATSDSDDPEMIFQLPETNYSLSDCWWSKSYYFLYYLAYSFLDCKLSFRGPS